MKNKGKSKNKYESWFFNKMNKIDESFLRVTTKRKNS